jgi:PLAT/LH2 domain/Family of unknown function (DUF6765)
MTRAVKRNSNQAVMLIAALSVLLMLRPVPAAAYEEDTHYTITYVMCRAMGFTDAEAQTVASYDQGMDDSEGTLANIGVTPQVTEEINWHALPPLPDPKLVLKRKGELWTQVLSEKNADAQLKRLGVFFHYQQDTWAHRRHPNQHATVFVPYFAPLGHAAHGHQPDRPPFDPVCALRCLEDGIGYARTFLTTALHRAPNRLFDNYQPAKGEVDGSWNDRRKGAMFNQLAADTSTPAHRFLTDLIRSQIDAYTTSLDANPNWPGRYTADEAKYAVSRDRLIQACGRAQLAIMPPVNRVRITTLTTAQIFRGEFGSAAPVAAAAANQGPRDYTVRIYTGNKSGAGTDANIFLSMKGTAGAIGEQRLNGLISGNAFERNQTDSCVLRGQPYIGEIVSITVRSDDKYLASAWYLGWVEISGPGLTTRRFTLNDWIESGKLTRTLTP